MTFIPTLYSCLYGPITGQFYSNYTGLNDTSYQMLQTDRLIEMLALTAGRIITLVPAASLPPGCPIIIADRSGNASSSTPITTTAQGTDTIGGQQSLIIANSKGSIHLISNGKDTWYSNF